MTKAFNIAVVGATGAVGEALFETLDQFDFPVAALYAIASERSAGKTIYFKKKTYPVLDINDFDFSKADIAFFSAGSSVSADMVPKATAAGCIVIDNTSHFREDKDIPLIVPEVNPEALADYKKRNIIANPNCSTIQMLVALKPIYDAVGITRINVATYQAVSGTGRSAISELVSQTGELLNGKPVNDPKVYPKQIAFNVIPFIDKYEINGYTREEMKMVRETRKIFADENIQVNPTAVRVPVFYGHSEALHIETRDKISAEAARALLSKAPGVVVMDDPANYVFPTPVPEGGGHHEVFVGRIREDISHPTGLDLWVVADNVRKGAATNSVQIAQLLIKDYL